MTYQRKRKSKLERDIEGLSELEMGIIELMVKARSSARRKSLRSKSPLPFHLASQNYDRLLKKAYAAEWYRQHKGKV